MRVTKNVPIAWSEGQPIGWHEVHVELPESIWVIFNHTGDPVSVSARGHNTIPPHYHEQEYKMVQPNE